MSADTKQKIRDGVHRAWLRKGDSFFTEDGIRRLKEKSSNRIRTPETCRRLSAALKGRVITSEHRAKLSLARKGVPNPKNRKKKTITEKVLAAHLRLKGKPSWNLGIPHSSETRMKISDHHLATGRFKAERNPNWRGGASPYPDDFNSKLKNLVRERDLNRCVLCVVADRKENKSLAIHHIDGNKNNNDILNLSCLCSRHHGLAQHYPLINVLLKGGNLVAAEDDSRWDYFGLNTILKGTSTST